jgi:hypothetical protein
VKKFDKIVKKLHDAQPKLVIQMNDLLDQDPVEVKQTFDKATHHKHRKWVKEFWSSFSSMFEIQEGDQLLKMLS